MQYRIFGKFGTNVSGLRLHEIDFRGPYDGEACPYPLRGRMLA